MGSTITAAQRKQMTRAIFGYSATGSLHPPSRTVAVAAQAPVTYAGVGACRSW